MEKTSRTRATAKKPSSNQQQEETGAGAEAAQTEVVEGEAAGEIERIPPGLALTSVDGLQAPGEAEVSGSAGEIERFPPGRAPASALARICPPVLSKTDPGNPSMGPNVPSV